MVNLCINFVERPTCVYIHAHTNKIAMYTKRFGAYRESDRTELQTVRNGSEKLGVVQSRNTQAVPRQVEGSRARTWSQVTPSESRPGINELGGCAW